MPFSLLNRTFVERGMNPTKLWEQLWSREQKSDTTDQRRHHRSEAFLTSSCSQSLFLPSKDVRHGQRQREDWEVEVVILPDATSAGCLLRAPMNLPQHTHSHTLAAHLVFHICAHTVGHVFGSRKGLNTEAPAYTQPNTSSNSAETA